SVLLDGDAAVAVAALKATPGPDLQVIGSGDLLHSLQRAGLVDQYHVWTFPLVLGTGKRLFAADAAATGLRLVHTATSSTGVVMSTYVTGVPLQTGTLATQAPSADELARRRRMADGLW